MPYITVKMLQGRSDEQKEKLYEKVTKAVSQSIGAPEEKIVVFIEEMTKENYAIAGKTME